MRLVDTTEGCAVLRVVPGSLAFTAGLEKGDMIIALGGRRTYGVHEFSRQLAKHSDGALVIEALRGGQFRRFNI